MAQKMKVYGSTHYGAPEKVLKVMEVDKPQPRSRDLIVRVHAVATNPVRLSCTLDC